MSDEFATLAFPADQLQAAATAIRELLARQWNRHQVIFHADPEAFRAGVGKLSPLAPAQVSGAMQSIDDWNSTLAAQYQAWYQLADLLEEKARQVRIAEARLAVGDGSLG